MPSTGSAPSSSCTGAWAGPPRSNRGHGASGALRSGPARWTFLTPEIGRLCRTFAGPVQDALVGRTIDYHRPSWFLAWGILSAHGHENCTDMPIHALSHFQAKAFLVETPAAELARAADIPWYRGDPYHVGD